MAFGSGLDDEDDVVSEINMTPLVDVMLVLLIIFIITAPVISHSVPLELPRASNQPAPAKPDSIHLALTSEGELRWNSEPITRAGVEQRFAELAHQANAPDVVLHGDRKRPYEEVIQLLAAARRAGLARISFATEAQD